MSWITYIPMNFVFSLVEKFFSRRNENNSPNSYCHFSLYLLFYYNVTPYKNEYVIIMITEKLNSYVKHSLIVSLISGRQCNVL